MIPVNVSGRLRKEWCNLGRTSTKSSPVNVAQVWDEGISLAAIWQEKKMCWITSLTRVKLWGKNVKQSLAGILHSMEKSYTLHWEV